VHTNIRELTETTFDEEIAAGDEPVVVDVWAQWCGPCHALEPVVATLAAERAGEVRFAAIDADAEPGIVRRFGVMALPTLLVFVDGSLAGRIVGARGRRHLDEEIERIIASASGRDQAPATAGSNH